MFYAVDILSMRSKTNISLLYYVSTIKNPSKRINKKELYSINIQETIQTILNPPQPYAMRLYSYFLLGIVKIYIFKLKNYENDINLLLKSLSYSKKPIRNNKVPSKRCKKQIEENIINKLLDESSNESMSFVEEHNNNDILNYEHFNDMISFENVKKSKFDKIDTTIVLRKEEYNTKAFLNNKKKISIPEVKIYDIYNFITTNEDKDYVSLECDNEYSSVERIRNTSLLSYTSKDDTVRSTCVLENKYFNGEDFLKINIGSRKERSMNFYILLERCTSGEIKVYQEVPFGKILIFN